jgi:hypothetical protein
VLGSHDNSVAWFFRHAACVRRPPQRRTPAL